MRKINKIMMATVSILLTLVLISSCVLSGIFAKYVTVKTAKSVMEFEKLGVDVTLSVPQETALRAQGAVITYPAENSNKVKAGVYEVTISGLPIGPGDDYRKLVKFKFSGNANVPVDVNVSTVVTYDGLDLKIPKETGIFGTTTDYYCLPIGFHAYAYYNDSAVGGEDGFSLGDSWRKNTELSKISADNRSKNISTNLWKNVDFDGNSVPKNKTELTKHFEPDVDDGLIVFYKRDKDPDNADKYIVDKNKPINTIVMGYWWPFSNEGANQQVTNVNQIDNVSTYLAQKNENATITITYTVTVTQTAAAT